VKRGLGLPIGSLTQLATIRLGKRTEGRTPPNQRPLCRWPVLNDLVFGGWDIYEDNIYQAATNARVLDSPLLEKLGTPALQDPPDEGRFRSQLRQAD